MPEDLNKKDIELKAKELKTKKERLKELKKELLRIKKTNKEEEKSRQQVKFYEDIVRKQQKREIKITEKKERKEFLRKESLLKKGTLGLLGGFVGGKLTETLKDILPGAGIISEAVSFVKERKKEQAEIAKERIGEQEEEITPTKKEEIQTEKESIETTETSFDKLIEVNRQGFESIVNTLLAIDKGEDVEEVMEKRDLERRRKKETAKRKEEIIPEEEEGGFFGILGKGTLAKLGKGLLIGGGILAQLFTMVKTVLDLKKIIEDPTLTKFDKASKILKEITIFLSPFGIPATFMETFLPNIYKSIEEFPSKVGDKIIKEGKKLEKKARKSIEETIEKIPIPFKKKEKGGFIGKYAEGGQFAMVGEKGRELIEFQKGGTTGFVYDNQATNMFMKAVDKLNKMPTGGADNNIFNKMLEKLVIMNETMKTDVELLKQISQQALGNNINIMGNNNIPSLMSNEVKLVYDSAKNVR